MIIVTQWLTAESYVGAHKQLKWSHEKRKEVYLILWIKLKLIVNEKHQSQRHTSVRCDKIHADKRWEKFEQKS